MTHISKGTIEEKVLRELHSILMNDGRDFKSRYMFKHNEKHAAYRLHNKGFVDKFETDAGFIAYEINKEGVRQLGKLYAKEKIHS